MNRFAERLKELREKKGLSQVKLAKQLKLDPTTIGKWESKKRVPNIESIIILCNYFKVSADFLIGLEN